MILSRIQDEEDEEGSKTEFTFYGNSILEWGKEGERRRPVRKGIIVGGMSGFGSLSEQRETERAEQASAGL